MENAPGGDAAAVQRRMAPGEPLQAGEQALGAKLLSQGHGRSVPAQQGVLVSWCPAPRGSPRCGGDVWKAWAGPARSQLPPSTREPHTSHDPVRAHRAREVALILCRTWVSDAAGLEDPSSLKEAALQGAELCQLLVFC